MIKASLANSSTHRRQARRASSPSPPIANGITILALGTRITVSAVKASQDQHPQGKTTTMTPSSKEPLAKVKKPIKRQPVLKKRKEWLWSMSRNKVCRRNKHRRNAAGKGKDKEVDHDDADNEDDEGL